ncbi:MAG TPA: hypothetical protein PLZ36_10750 [Armatimonadota bacterium]|nr:hypothetical protein [Armatimonadota bacterium]
MTTLLTERTLVRELARTIAELAASPENAARIRRWRDVNGLRRPDRAPVYCRPVGCWEELLPEERLRCTDPWLRGIERQFRRQLIKAEIGDDDPLEPSFPVGAAFAADPPNLWGVEVGRHAATAAGGAWAYDPPLKTEADFAKLAMPRVTYLPDETGRRAERAHGLLGDILPVRVVCDAPLGATLGTAAADLRGLTAMMMDTVDDPALLHRLMAHLRDATLAAMDAAEASGLLTPNTTGPMLCSDPIGPPDGPVTFANCWCMANSQEFDQISPARWEEFCLAYQLPIFARCGLVAYGCCENLTRKMEGVLCIPNLRIFVCSAWTDLDRVIERVGSHHVIMWRQKASDVIFAADDGALRAALEDGMRRLRGCHVQIVLRELQTLAGNLDRLHVWTRLAIAAAEAWSA